MDEKKQEIIEEIKNVAKMSAEEYTLYRKWEEIYSKNWTELDKIKIREIRNQLWKPEDVNDYLKLEPELVFIDNDKDNKIWNILRVFCSSAHWNVSPGRLLRFYVRDKVTGQYLGIISLGSDFIALGGRDKYIGWTQEDKLKKGRLNHTAMGSTIVPTQPLGYNYVGGKLISLLVLSDTVEKVWNRKYKEKLVGVSTTSLYGGFSQYNRLKYWRKCSSTEGKVLLEPTNETFEKIKVWLKENYQSEYEKLVADTQVRGQLPKSHPKPKVVALGYKKLKIKPPETNFSRGVYFGSLYKNTREFLSFKDSELGEKAFDNSVEALTKLWKEQYANKRVVNLTERNGFNFEPLFYDQLLELDWETAKSIYLKDVGR